MTAIASQRCPPWLTFVITWLSLGLVVLVPRFDDGYLSNAWPVLVGYLSVVLGDTHVVPLLLPWAALHTLFALVVTMGIVVVRPLIASRRWVAAAALSIGMFVGLVGWALHECWPDGLYFDAHTTYYDVGNLVRSAPAKAAGLSSAADLAKYVFEQGAEHHLPYYIGTISGSTTIIAWGFWPEHRRLRKALEAFRDT